MLDDRGADWVLAVVIGFGPAVELVGVVGYGLVEQVKQGLLKVGLTLGGQGRHGVSPFELCSRMGTGLEGRGASKFRLKCLGLGLVQAKVFQTKLGRF